MTFLAQVAREAGTVFSAEFAEDAVYTPSGGSARMIAGIFDRLSEVTDIGEMVERDGVAATFNIETAVASAAAIGDMVSVRGYDYRVVGVEPDGTGRTVLVLGI